MLDELDALMQRMLAVPVQPPEEMLPPARQEPPPPQTPRPQEVATVPAAPVTVAAPTVERPREEPVVVPAPLIVRAGPVDFVPPAEPAETEMSAPTYLPLGAEPLLPIIYKRPKNGSVAVPATRIAPPALPPQKALEPLAPARPAWLNPALARTAPPPQAGWFGRQLQIVNRSYDRATEMLGTPGRWLRSDAGRSILGWTGLAMLVAAVVWAAVRFLG
jgi:hypothetical protein